MTEDDARERAELVVAGEAAPIELAIAAWLDAKHKRSGSERTLHVYGETLRRFRAFLRARDLDLHAGIRADDRAENAARKLTAVALLAQAWAGEGSPRAASFNQRLAIVSSFYTFARKQGLLNIDNPIQRVERARVQRYAGARPLDPGEVRRRLAAIDREDLFGARDYALLTVALQTGRRVAELAGLRWGDVEQAGGKVILHWRRTKGGKTMDDAVPRGVANALLNWLEQFYGPDLRSLPPGSPVWVSLSSNGTWGEPLDVQSIADICYRWLGTSKVHALRHTWARAMEDAGAKVSDIQARLGHESLDTTGRYLAALRKADNAHADALAELFGFDGDGGAAPRDERKARG